MDFNRPVTELIKQRTSTRTYQERPIEAETQAVLDQKLDSFQFGPLGNPTRFELVAASLNDSRTLRGLGTYGFIKNPTGFIVGAAGAGDGSLEDFGYLMEKAILYATDLGLGTCWLGGSFTKSRFAQKINIQPDETIPAVTALGYIAQKPRRLDGEIRNWAKADRRLPWEKLFYNNHWGVPLSKTQNGAYSIPLEMVRIGPSASNRQPWRILKDEETWHFYLRRTRGYRDNPSSRLLRLEDLQRVDIGIAMCHFELSALEAGLNGRWMISEPEVSVEEDLTEYVVSWVPVE